jgi:hypothetical protein
MKTQKAILVTMSPQFGRFLVRVKDDPSMQSLQSKGRRYVDDYMSGRIHHKNYRVSVCDVPVLEQTGLKIFDKAYDGNGGTFMTGNVSSDIQQSWHVRPFSQTECNGKQYAPGHLRDFDLMGLREKVGVVDGARHVLSWFDDGSKKLSAQDSSILYMVFHRTPEKTSRNWNKIIHGWIHTDVYGNLLNQLELDNSPKSHLVMEKARKVFTYERFNEEDLLVVEGGEITVFNSDFLGPEDESVELESQRVTG